MKLKFHVIFGFILSLSLGRPSFSEPLKSGVTQWERLPFNGSVSGGSSESTRLNGEAGSADSSLPFRGVPALTAEAPSEADAWKLQVTPMSLNFGPESLIHLHYWTDLRPSGRAEAWNSWGSRILHMVFANLNTFRGNSSEPFEQFTIYVRSDGQIKMTESGNVSTGNLQSLRTSVEALNGLPDLKFPTPLRDDTVFVTGQLGYGVDQSGMRDVWGRRQDASSTLANRMSW